MPHLCCAVKRVRLRHDSGVTNALGSYRRFLRKARDLTRILDIAQIALLEFGQRMQRKSSAAKVSILLCEGLDPNWNA